MRFQKGQNTGASNPRWAGEKPVNKNCGRQRARRLFPGQHVCQIEGCGKKAERHHKDDDTSNNDASNIAFLCHKHHVEADGRMSRRALRDALRAVTAGRPLSAEHRAKIGIAHRGMKRSADARKAMSDAMKASYAARQRPTHCPQGHPYDDANRSLAKDGRVSCKACARARALRNYYAPRHAADRAGAM